MSQAYGEKLFCGAVDAWKSERVQTCVAGLLAHMPAVVGEVEVNKLFSTMANVTEKMDKAALARNRVITVDFRGLSLEIEAGSVSEELSLRLFAYIKERVGADKLPSLPFEMDLPKYAGLLVIGGMRSPVF